MGFFDIFKKKDSNITQVAGNGSNINQAGGDVNVTSEPPAPYKLDLRKKQVGIILEKNNLQDEKAQVSILIDWSGSMYDNVYLKVVQKIVERILPIALSMDKDKTMSTWIFTGGFKRIVDVTEKNYDGFVQDKIIKPYDMPRGGTTFLPVLTDTWKEHGDSKIPTFIIMFTDGNNDDEETTERFLKHHENDNVYLHIVGIGKEKFCFVNRIKFKNVKFTKIENIDKATDEFLYETFIEGYKKWKTGKSN